MEKVNPKALNIEGLSTKESKVTLGFKCHAKLKLKLALEAQNLHLTLSEYVESIICNHGRQSNVVNRTMIEPEEMEELKRKVAIYENQVMILWLEKDKGRLIKYYGMKGNMKYKFIESIEDLYDILIDTAQNKHAFLNADNYLD
jgi:hypothetical protein